MRQRFIGILVLSTVVCLTPRLNHASDRQPRSEAGAQTTGTGAVSGPGDVLELQGESQQGRGPIAGADLEIRLGGQTRKDVTNEQGR